MSPDVMAAHASRAAASARAADVWTVTRAAAACNGARAMVGLLAGRTEEHVEGIADDLRDCAVVRKNDIGHACEVFIEKRSEHARLKRLHQSGKPRNVGKKRCNFAALTCKVDCIVVASKSLHKIR